jgi:hypothetical protein
VDFELTETIPAPRAEVEKALADPAYYASLGHHVSNIERPELLGTTVADGVAEISVRYAFAGSISGPAKMAVDVDKLTWVIHTRLDLREHAAELEVVPDHYDGMLSCSASMKLDEAQGITTETIRGSISVHIPLIGATAEKLILDGLSDHMAAEAAALGRYCAGSSTS